MRKALLLTCYCIFFCLSIAQSQKLPNTLLWRIDGNGLQKPSYLYGTMHLTDERVFNLGDSLYKAIENSEGFAIEVNPEEMTAYLIDEISQQIKNAILIKGVLTKKEFDEYAPALSKKLKKPADEITTRDIFLEKNKWVKESFREGKMATFLDAYLFDVARRLGKWTGGVEDIDDQKGLINELVDESDIRQIATDDEGDEKKEADKFVDVYASGNLNAIDSMSNTEDSAYKDALLIKRNLKMSNRIDSMDKTRSMVFAIGAAHLPGDQGLISLLQQKGYKLHPVFSSKKIAVQNYKVKEVAIPWLTINDEDSLYKVDMPGKPGDIEMFGVLKMKMYFDIFNSTGYMVTASAVPYNKKGIDSIMNLYATTLFKQKDPKKLKAVTINGINGKELELTDEDGYKHGYILSKNNIIYIVLGLSVKQNLQTQNIIKRFLSSYQPYVKKENNEISFYTYTDPDNLYTIDLPSKPQSANSMIDVSQNKSVKYNLLISPDSKTGAYFFIGISKTAPGYFIENDSTSLRRIGDNTIEKFTSLTLDTLYTENEKRILKLEGVMAKTNLFAKIHYQSTGNRWYGIMAMYDSAKVNPYVDHFFQSFKLLTPAATQWKQQSSADEFISAWMPDVITLDPKDSSTLTYLTKYESYDSVKGNSYDVIGAYTGKYYWQNSDSALWKSTTEIYNIYADSIFSQRRVTNGDSKGIEIQMRQHGSFNVTRKRILLYGDSLYTLITVQPQQFINDSNLNKFFDDFRFNRLAPPSTVFTSKAKQLLTDLFDKDSAISAEAQKAIATANFDKSNIPILYEALMKTYPRSNNDYRTINDDLKYVIKNIKDSASLKLAKENYALTTSRQIKSLLLDIISDYKTKENYEDIKNLLLKSRPDTGLSYYFIENMKDSLLLTAEIINGMFPLIKDTALAPAIIDVSSTLLDSNVIQLSSLQPYLTDILAFADYEYKKRKTGKEENNYQDFSMTSLLGKFNDTQANAMLQKLLSTGDNYFKIEIIEILLQNAQPVAAPVILKIAADKASRVDLYNKLKKYKKQSLFPKQYLTQPYFAESILYANASDDSDPEDVTFLSQKTFLYHNKQAKFFFYKITFGEDDEKTFYLGCAGPYDLNTANISVDDAHGSIYFKEEFDKTKLQEQMKELIKQMEEEE